MRISFVRHSILSRGGDRMALEHAGCLAEMGHEVTIWATRIDTVFPISPRIKIKPLASKSKLDTIIKALFTKFPSDLIIADIIAMVSVLSFRNKQILYFSQDYDVAYYSSTSLRWLVRILYFYALRLRHIPTIAVAHHLGDLLTSRFHAQVTVVVNGIDFSKFYPQPDPQLLSNKGVHQAIAILGRSDYHKGLDIAIKVLKAAATFIDLNSMEVWVFGEIVDIPGISVKNFGLVGHEMMRKILSSADILLFPTRHEGLPLLILEAWACGCPIVTTTAAGIVENEQDGLVSPVENIKDLNEKLVRLLKDAGLKERLRAGGYVSVKRYDLNKSNSDFATAIIALTNKKRKV
jgi:glycosyltransferase involved in cell wall biosynthesis